MATPPPGELFVAIGAVVHLFGGVIAFTRLSVTKYHIPVLVLALLTVTIGLTSVVGAGAIFVETQKIDYRVDQCHDGWVGTSGPGINAEFSELSPAAQEVFRSALQADEKHTRWTNPDDFALETDTTVYNQIEYESTCYLLRATPRGDFGDELAITFIVFFGGFVTLLFGILSVVSFRRGSVKLPTSILAGLGSVGGLLVIGATQLRQLAAATVLGVTLTWMVLRVFELRSDESFQERMKG